MEKKIKGIDKLEPKFSKEEFKKDIPNFLDVKRIYLTKEGYRWKSVKGDNKNAPKKT